MSRSKVEYPSVICSPLSSRNDPKLVGMTVKEVRSKYGKKFDILPHVRGYLNGIDSQPAPELYKLRGTDVLRFSRATGTKCSITFCTFCKKTHCLEHGECLVLVKA